MRAGRLSVACLSMLVVACSGAPNTAPGSAGGGATLPVLSPAPIDLSAVPGRIHVDSTKGSSAWIGPAGGTLTTTSRDGTTYELAIPALAVLGATPITMTAIGSIDDLGLSGGLAGAVYLGPRGLRLGEPAILTITSSRPAPAGDELVGFDVGDDGSTELVPATSTGNAVTVQVFHFSAPGAGFGTTEDLQRFGPSPSNPVAVETRFAHGFSELLTEPTPWSDGTMLEAFAFINVIWSQVLRPDLTTVHGDHDLLIVLSSWREFVLLLNLYAHRGDLRAAVADGVALSSTGAALVQGLFNAGQGLVAARAQDAMTGNKTLCSQSHDLVALANIWFWAGIGERYAPTQAEWLDAAKGCADLDLGPTNLPTGLTAGTAGSLTIQFVMAFTDGTRTNVDVEETLTATGLTFGRTGAPTASAGIQGGTTLTEGVLAQTAPPYGLLVHACWSLDGVLRALCHDFTKSFGAGPTEPPAPTPTPSSSPPGIDFSYLAGTYSVRLICQNATYGSGTGTVAVAGAHVSMSWSIAIGEPSDASGDCDASAKNAAFPLSGSFAGDAALGPGGTANVTLSAWQVAPCLDPAPASPTGVAFRGTAVGLPISTCVLSSLFGQMGYQASRTGP